MIYSLPIDFSKLPLEEDDIIDMSMPNFPVDDNNQNKAALLFIRNTGIKSKFDFSKCNFESKSEFLNLYLKGTMMNINVPELTETWISILTCGYFDINIKSILTDDEIIKFKENNKSFIFELHRFLISIPLCAMSLLNMKTGNFDIKLDMRDFEKSDFKEFNYHAFSHLFDYKEIIMLSQVIENITPVFYEYYFDFNNQDLSSFINKLINKYPYLSILNIMTNGDEIKNMFISGISDMLNPNKEE